MEGEGGQRPVDAAGGDVMLRFRPWHDDTLEQTPLARIRWVTLPFAASRS